MKQVIQNFKTGELDVKEVPVPSISPGMVLVENSFSLISSGTEKATVKIGKANILNKARQRPDLVTQVLQNIKREGIKATIDKVRTKLDTPKALGYSTSGKVVASMDRNNRFQPGDKVACAGQDYASHAEVVAVPQNLVAKIPDNVSDEDASFTTLGAIALQGVRQADPRIGECLCVIGLGLLGQITCQLLKTAGCNVYGIDLSEKLVSIASKFTDTSCARNDENLQKDILDFTGGVGFDRIIITASTSSNDPLSLAGEIARKKGIIVVVGAVGMEIQRDPHYYRKELDLKMSCSYGPGRYDPFYEESGHDYPIAYVRWTEQRNMQAFLQMLSKKQINLGPLITHRFEIDQAEEAYKLILAGDEFHLGILIGYPPREEKLSEINFPSTQPKVTDQISAAFIGAGSFAQSYLIPNVKKEGVLLHSVSTSKGISAQNIASKFGFQNAVSNQDEIWSNKNINTVFIATRHNSHASLVKKGLESGKHVFVEKPLAMNYEELKDISEVVKNNSELSLLVGYNRRFSKAAAISKGFFKNLSGPKMMNFRVNAGQIPPDSWIQQEDIGGGRIIGEICHFIDLMQFFTGADPIQVYAGCLPGDEILKNDDNITVTIRFSDDSVGTIFYVSNGGKSLPKEWLEVYAGGKTAIIDDFKSVKLYGESSFDTEKVSGKGHAEEIDSFIQSIKKGRQSPITFKSIYLTTLATFKIKDALATGLSQDLK